VETKRVVSLFLAHWYLYKINTQWPSHHQTSSSGQ